MKVDFNKAAGGHHSTFGFVKAAPSLKIYSEILYARRRNR